MDNTMSSHTNELLEIAKSSEDVASSLKSLYNLLPLDVRFRYGRSCIDKFLSTLLKYKAGRVDSGAVQNCGHIIYTELCRALEEAKNVANFLEVQNLNNWIEQIGRNFESDCKSFFEYLANCVEKEKEIIELSQLKRKDTESKYTAHSTPTEDLDEQMNFQCRLKKTLQDCCKVDVSLQQFTEIQDNFILQNQNTNIEICDLKKKLQTMPNDAVEKNIQALQRDQNNKAQDFYHKRHSLFQEHANAIKCVQENIFYIWKALEQWHNDKKLEITGLRTPHVNFITFLEYCCTEANKMLLHSLTQAKTFVLTFEKIQINVHDGVSEDVDLKEACNHVKLLENLLKRHLENVFIVEEEPPQVVKVVGGRGTGSGFRMAARLLGGKSLLDVKNSLVKVSAVLYKEEDISTVIKERNFNKKPFCDVQNGMDKLIHIDQINGPLKCCFNVQLQKVPQLNRGVDRLVTEFTYAMVFFTTLNLNDEFYQLATISLPMKLITNSSQECQAKSYLIWDAAFSQPDSERTAFVHLKEVEWGEVAKVLNSFFYKNTDAQLSKEHLHSLAKIAFKEKRNCNFEKRKITQNRLLKDKLYKKSKNQMENTEIEQEFSFWRWFYANMSLVKELKREWVDGIIHGYIDKESIQQKLASETPGTFLVRFSEKDIEKSNRPEVRGCLAIAVVQYSPDSGNKVFHVKDNLNPQEITRKGLVNILEAFEFKDYFSKKKQRLLTTLYSENQSRNFDEICSKYIIEKQTDDVNYKSARPRFEVSLYDFPDSLSPNGPMAHYPMSPSSMATNSPLCEFEQKPVSPVSNMVMPLLEQCDIHQAVQPSEDGNQVEIHGQQDESDWNSVSLPVSVLDNYPQVIPGVMQQEVFQSFESGDVLLSAYSQTLKSPTTSMLPKYFDEIAQDCGSRPWVLDANSCDINDLNIPQDLFSDTHIPNSNDIDENLDLEFLRTCTTDNSGTVAVQADINSGKTDSGTSVEFEINSGGQSLGTEMLVSQFRNI